MNAIQLKEVDSCGELQELLRVRGGKLIGDPRGADHCYLLEIPEGLGYIPLGLAAQTHGLEPAVVLLPRTTTLLALHGMVISRVNGADGALIYSMKLDMPAYEFLRIEENGAVVILHELGLIKLSDTGEVVWTQDTYVVEGHSVSGDIVTLDIEGGVQRRYSLTSGRPL